MTTLFGTDGVRGVANRGPMTPQEILRLGFAAGTYFRQLAAGGRPVLVVGRDTRASSDMIESALVAGLLSAGIDVRRAGVVPTPAISFLVRHTRADGGGVVSASHNPFPDNGVKFFTASGEKLSEEEEGRIEAILTGLDDSRIARDQADRTGDRVGQGRDLEDARAAYEEFARTTGGGVDLAGMRIVVDCANGAAHRTTPNVLAAMGADVLPIHDRPDGRNINEGCGSLHVEAVASAVRQRRADLGITHDGDADRCLMVDSGGDTVDGDLILGMCARHLRDGGGLRGDGVVTTVMSNIGLGLALRRIGVRVVTTQVGDRFVKQAMDREGIVLGGEPSGHIIYSELSPTGDGLLTALQVLRIMVVEDRPLCDLHGFVTLFPQVLLNVPVGAKPALDDLPAVRDAVRSTELEFGAEGRVVLRYSGTEPVARVMVEGPSHERVRFHAEAIARAIRESVAE